MIPSVRLVTLVYPETPAAVTDPTHPWHRYDQLRRILRRHLPATTAEVLARPEVATDGSGAVVWSSERAGQPIPLTDLGDAEQTEARRLLTDHLQAIDRLARDLARREPVEAEPASLLSRALLYPGDESVYVVDGAPVILSWGGTDPGQPPGAGVDPATESDATAPPAPPAGERRLGAWPWTRLILPTLGLAALGALGWLAWTWYQGQTELALSQDLQAALASQCEPRAPLLELATRIERLDPTGERHAEALMAIRTELGICEEADQLAAQLAAGPPCDHLPALRDELDFYAERQPFAALRAEVERRHQACVRVATLSDQLAAAGGDCPAIAALEPEIAALAEPAPELAVLRLELEQAGNACRLAAELAPRLAATAGQCPSLRALARETAPALAMAATERAPLRELKDELATALERCELADHLERELAHAMDDCVALAGLNEILARHEPRREPFTALAARLETALGQCRALKLGAELEIYRNNLRFADIRERLLPELKTCAEVQALETRIAALGGDCAATRKLAAQLTDPDFPGQGHPSYAQARDALKRPLAECARVARLTDQLAAAGGDCARLRALARELKRDGAPALQAIRQQLDERLKPCQPPPPKPVVASQPAADRGSFPLRGDCSGRLILTPSSGWDGDRIRHIVEIDPPASERAARVVSSNPGCPRCELRKVGRNTWRADLFYGCGGRGIVPVSYSVFDAAGRVICSGSGSDLCLGRR